MEERKCRRRSLRNLRRSSSIWVVPSEAVLRGIEIERENLQTTPAYGSAWLGENTLQDIISNSQRHSPEDAAKGFFPPLDVCATDEMPAKVIKNSVSEWAQHYVASSKPETEMQCSNSNKFEISHNLSRVSSSSSSIMVQESGKIKSPSFANTHISMGDRKRAQNANFLSTLSSKISLKNQNRNTNVHQMKPQKKEGSLKCEPMNLNLQQAKAKSNGLSGSTPSFLKTTQSFTLKHSVTNSLQSLKTSVSYMRSSKATKTGNLHSPSKTGHFVSIQSKPLLASSVRKDVRPDLKNSPSKLNTLKPANNDIVNGEREKPKSRKRLSLRKSTTATQDQCLSLNESIQIGALPAQNDLIENSADSSQFMTNLVNVNSCEMNNETLNVNNTVNSQIEDIKTMKSSNFDIEMTEELLKSFDLPLFPSSQSIQEAKEKVDKDKRKSLRTSRYFSPFEMPLSKPSLEDEPESQDSLGNSIEDSPFTPSDKEIKSIDMEPTPLNGLITTDCPSDKKTMEDPVNMTPVQNICADSSVGIDLEDSPLCYNSENKENIAEEINNINDLLTGPGKNYFYEANTKLIEEMMDDFKNMSVVEAIIQDKDLQVNETMSSKSEDVSFDLNGNRREGETFKTIVPNYVTLSNGSTPYEGDDERSTDKICTRTIEDQVEMMELALDKNTSCNIDCEIEMTELESCPRKSLGNNLDSNIFDVDSMNVRRNLRARKSWDFSQTTKPQEGKTARKRNSDGPSSASSRSKKRPSESSPSTTSKGVEKEISPGLRDLYLNKNYVLPKAKTWETIKESPSDDRSLFTKQKSKRFLQFEAGVTTAKLQRRHKKAVELKKKFAIRNVSLSDEEFRRKLLDVQLLLDE